MSTQARWHGGKEISGGGRKDPRYIREALLRYISTRAKPDEEDEGWSQRRKQASHDEPLASILAELTEQAYHTRSSRHWSTRGDTSTEANRSPEDIIEYLEETTAGLQSGEIERASPEEVPTSYHSVRHREAVRRRANDEE